jgi:hypothetical protein
VRTELLPVANVAAAACAVILAVAGCATTPIPNESIAVAKSSVQRAEQSGAPEFAAVQFAAAQDKLAQAEKAADRRDSQTATMMAEQSNIDARLSEAMAEQQRSHRAAMEFDASMQALRQESSQNTQTTH